MASNYDINEKNLDFLVSKSRDLLNEQFKSYDSAINKAGLLISLLSIFIPIAIYLISKDIHPTVKIFGIIPISFLTISMSLLLKVLLPKKLDTGFNFDQFEQKLNGDCKDLLLYEIGANRSSFKDNQGIVSRQNLYFKLGIIFVYVGTISLMLILVVNLFV